MAAATIRSISPALGSTITSSALSIIVTTSASIVGNNSTYGRTRMQLIFWGDGGNSYLSSQTVYPTSYSGTTCTFSNISIPSGTDEIYASFSIANTGYSEMAETSGYYYPQIASLTAPGTPEVTQDGGNYLVSWSAATGSNGSGNVTYTVHYGSRTYDAQTATSATIAIPSDCYGVATTFYVTAAYSGVTADSGAVTCTASKHKTVKYYDGSAWVECVVQYYDGSAWVECVPKYYDGTQWVECSF